jgi:hypothetical protein
VVLAVNTSAAASTPVYLAMTGAAAESVAAPWRSTRPAWAPTTPTPCQARGNLALVVAVLENRQ